MSAPGRLLRALPSLGAMALVFAAAAGMRGGASGVAAADSCDSALVCSPANDVFPMARYWGVAQPFDPTTNVQACSLRVQPVYNDRADARIVVWDAAAQTADASSVPLRWFPYSISALQINHLRVDLGSRPVVTRRVGHLADPPAAHYALDLNGPSFLSGGESISYDHSGPLSMPSAWTYPIATPAARVPLPGAHPVLSYGTCAGDAATQALVLGQSVMTANSVLDTTWYEIAQRVRVPVALQLSWCEFAMDDPLSADLARPAGVVQIADGVQALPVGVFAATAAAATFGQPPALPQWVSHTDFDQLPVLMPDHDYWVLLRTLHDYSFRTRVITGAESSDFQNAIGPLYARRSANGAWTQVPARALSMRLIGTPTGAVGVASPPMVPGAPLHLVLTPDPARGPVQASWRGGAGHLDIEVLDARGRRISGATSADAASGHWLWSGAGADGRAAPPGIYFVRVRDRDGNSAVQRVAVVR